MPPRDRRNVARWLLALGALAAAVTAVAIPGFIGCDDLDAGTEESVILPSVLAGASVPAAVLTGARKPRGWGGSIASLGRVLAALVAGVVAIAVTLVLAFLVALGQCIGADVSAAAIANDGPVTIVLDG